MSVSVHFVARGAYLPSAINDLRGAHFWRCAGSRAVCADEHHL